MSPIDRIARLFGYYVVFECEEGGNVFKEFDGIKMVHKSKL